VVSSLGVAAAVVSSGPSVVVSAALVVAFVLVTAVLLVAAVVLGFVCDVTAVVCVVVPLLRVAWGTTGGPGMAVSVGSGIDTGGVRTEHRQARLAVVGSGPFFPPSIGTPVLTAPAVTATVGGAPVVWISAGVSGRMCVCGANVRPNATASPAPPNTKSAVAT
jgi:hypothetical protein